MLVVRPEHACTVSVPLQSRNQNFERQTPTPGCLLIHVYVHEKHHGVDKSARGQHEMVGGRKVKDLRLYLHTAQKRSLGASLSVPRSCEIKNPCGKSSQTSKKP